MGLLSALHTIERSQSEYRIDIVSDGLEGLTTTANVSGLDAVKAVKRVCKGLPVKVKVHGKRIYVSVNLARMLDSISAVGTNTGFEKETTSLDRVNVSVTDFRHIEYELTTTERPTDFIKRLLK